MTTKIEDVQNLTPNNAGYWYVHVHFFIQIIAEFQLVACLYKQSRNSLDPDPMASEKPADPYLHYFHTENIQTSRL